MIRALRVLDELRGRVETMREEGESDLRTVLHWIDEAEKRCEVEFAPGETPKELVARVAKKHGFAQSVITEEFILITPVEHEVEGGCHTIEAAESDKKSFEACYGKKAEIYRRVTLPELAPPMTKIIRGAPSDPHDVAHARLLGDRTPKPLKIVRFTLSADGDTCDGCNARMPAFYYVYGRTDGHLFCSLECEHENQNVNIPTEYAEPLP